MLAIHKRRAFIDPTCPKCGDVEVKYSRGQKARHIIATCPKCKQQIERLFRSKVPVRVRLAVDPSRNYLEMKYRPRPSEFEIQAYLYCELRRLGYDVRGEVATKDGDSRFDLVVFSKQRPVRIIEVKSCHKRCRAKQLDQYRTYGIKVLAVCGMKEAQELIQRASGAGARTPLPLLVWKE